MEPGSQDQVQEKELDKARTSIKTTGWTSTETGIWDTVFAFAHEFGWTAHYVIQKLPLVWIRKLMQEMKTYAEMQENAVHGGRSIPKEELTAERKEEKDRKLAELYGLDYERVKSDKIFG